MKFEIKKFEVNNEQCEIVATVDQEALVALVRLNIVRLLKQYANTEMSHE